MWKNEDRFEFYRFKRIQRHYLNISDRKYLFHPDSKSSQSHGRQANRRKDGTHVILHRWISILFRTELLFAWIFLRSTSFSSTFLYFSIPKIPCPSLLKWMLNLERSFLRWTKSSESHISFCGAPSHFNKPFGIVNIPYGVAYYIRVNTDRTCLPVAVQIVRR